MAEKVKKVGSLPEFTTKEQLCKLFGLSSRRIEQLVQDGTLQTTKVGKRNCFETVDTCKTYIKFLSDKAYGRASKANEDELKTQKLLAEISLKESQSELHNLRTEIAKGNYISVDEVKSDYTRFFVIFKNFAGQLPSKLAGRLSGILEPVEVRQIEQELQKEVAKALGSFVSRAVKSADDIELDPTKPKKMGRPKKNVGK